MIPPPQFRVWWEVVESCSGKRARFDDVKWFEVAGEPIVARGDIANAAWFASGNRIALYKDDIDGALVRHEMLHAILQDGDHSREYFRERCGDVVVCGHVCGLPDPPPNSTPISLDDVQVTVDAYPRFPSFSLHDGRMTFVLNIRNTTSANAYLPQGAYNAGSCPSGILLSSVADPDRIALACDYPMSGGYTALYRPGETRSFVFDIDLRHPGDGAGPFFAERITVAAVLANNVRHTAMVSLLP